MLKITLSSQSLSRDFNRTNGGFTLIELLIVVAIIGILAAVATPSYLGMQERGKKGNVIRVAESNLPEIMFWMTAAKKTGTIQENLVEVDTDGDGVLDRTTDLKNKDLATTGVLTQWVTAHPVGRAASPWNTALPLWNPVIAGAADLDACEGTAIASSITLCFSNVGGANENAGIRMVFVAAKDRDGNTVFKKAASVD